MDGVSNSRVRPMRRGYLLIVLAVLAVGVAGANTAPLADAGLDQQVESGTTVYLDAGGSTDPDGTIVGYEWSIAGPNGADVRPDCPTCNETRFVPNRTGEYEVTVTVTDDDGATGQDTLFVTVEQAVPPSVDVSGPGSVLADNARTYRAEATAGDDALSTVVWRIDGSHHANTRITGDSATVTEEIVLSDGEHAVTATVVDSTGKRDTDRQSVRAVESGTNGETNGGDGGNDGLIRYDAEADEWSVNHDLASRITGSVEVGDAVVTTTKLEAIDTSEGVVRAFKHAGISESQMVQAAAQQKNNFEATGQGTLDSVDNSVGRVDFTGEFSDSSPGSILSVGNYGGVDSYTSSGGNSGGGSSADGGGAGGHSTNSRSSAASGGTSVGL